MTRAQIDFTTRNDEGHPTNCTEFATWYIDDDIQHLIWRIFTSLPVKKKENYFNPYVFFDGAAHIGLDVLVRICVTLLEESKKRFFPFIIKPETGSAHYMAGILRQNSNGISFFLFDPIGYATEERRQAAVKRLQIPSIYMVGGVPLTVSPHRIQSPEKDNGIYSCGPLCVEFLRYAIEHPEWIEALDDDFNLPPFLMQYQNDDKETYRAKIIDIRKAHYELLGLVPDAQIQIAEDFHHAISEAIWTRMEYKKPATPEMDLFDVDDADDEELQAGDDEDYESASADEQDDVADTKDASVFDVKKDPHPEDFLISSEEHKGNQLPAAPDLPQVSLASNKAMKRKDELQSESPPLPLVKRTLPHSSFFKVPEKKFPAGVEKVQKEIDRLAKLTGFFSIGVENKIAKINAALINAIDANVQDVTQDAGVREALASHRLFGFFGLKTATSLINIDKQEDESSKKLL